MQKKKKKKKKKKNKNKKKKKKKEEEKQQQPALHLAVVASHKRVAPSAHSLYHTRQSCTHNQTPFWL